MACSAPPWPVEVPPTTPTCGGPVKAKTAGHYHQPARQHAVQHSVRVRQCREGHLVRHARLHVECRLHSLQRRALQTEFPPLNNYNPAQFANPSVGSVDLPVHTPVRAPGFAIRDQRTCRPEEHHAAKLPGRSITRQACKGDMWWAGDSQNGWGISITSNTHTVCSLVHLRSNRQRHLVHAARRYVERQHLFRQALHGHQQSFTWWARPTIRRRSLPKGGHHRFQLHQRQRRHHDLHLYRRAFRGHHAKPRPSPNGRFELP